MRWIIATVALFAFASAAEARPPAKPAKPARGSVQLHAELAALSSDLKVLQTDLEGLHGHYKTLISLRTRLKSMRQRVKWLSKRTPRVVYRTPRVVTRIVEKPIYIDRIVERKVYIEVPVAPKAPKGPFAMSNKRYKGLVANVKGESFSRGKLGVIRHAAKKHFFSVGQVRTLMGMLSFDRDKLTCVSILRRRIVNADEAYTLASALTFSSNKQKLRKLLP